jgi:ABC-type amino acid transport substrate-binding protein
MVIAKVVGIVTIWIIAFLPVKATAGDDSTASEKLMVATMVAPPFAMKTADGRWEGLSIELWQAIVQELGVEYELIEYGSIGQIMEAFEKKELDALIAMAIAASRENVLDLSHAYLRSGSAIAVPAVIPGHSLFDFSGHFVDRFASMEFLLLIGLLVLLSFAAGALVWIFEGRRNREMFGGGAVKGLGQGIWWAMVTMTTVGYGDKAPKTLGGRIVALIWMFASIILVASFTAAITASLTVGELSGKVRGLRDLYGVRVGAVDQSGALNFLAQRGIAALPFENEQMGLQAIVDKKIDAFVYNEFILKYRVGTEFPGRVHVLSDTFNHYYVGIAMPPGSPLREPVNRAWTRRTGSV